MQESSKKNVLRVISAQDSIEDTEVSGAEPLQFCGAQLLPLCSLHRVNTHILSYTDTSAPYTRSMKRLRKSCERRSFICIQMALEAGVLVHGPENISDSTTCISLPPANPNLLIS